MRKIICLGFLILLFSWNMTAQEHTAGCAKERSFRTQLAKIAVDDPAEDDYDIRHVKLNVRLDNSSVTIGGDVTTTAVVAVPSMPAYVFELNNQLTVDSVKVNNQLLTVGTNGDVRTVTLPSALSHNTVFTAQVFYHGTINSGTAFYSTGIRNDNSPTWGNQVTYTMSEPYDSKDWWPTKQSLTDKIDSADIWITVPSNLKAGSNGVLQTVTPMPGNQSRYEWKTRYPMDYYLLSLAVASYVEYSYYVHFPGSNDSMLVQNYVYDNPLTLPTFKSRIDSVGPMITYFSQLFGRYPFWEEKYGHCMAPLSGGMEHQTMTTLGHFGTTLTAHELAHQWFGDQVTCGSWKDIWLNEGFASYSEYLYVAHFRSQADAFTYMLDKHNNVLNDPGGSVYVNDTTNVGRIFSGRLTYDKGASVVHTLRFVFNNDSLFFQALRAYQSQFKNKTALTPDFQNVAEQVLGQDLDTFFNQWIYGEGYPIYAASWNQVGNQVYVKLDNATTHPSVSFFSSPLELRFHSTLGDTVVRVNNNMPAQVFSFTWGKPMANMSVDPNDWLLNHELPVVRDFSLSTGTIGQTGFRVYPNPTGKAWQVMNLGGTAELSLSDMQGRILWQGQATDYISIEAETLPTGVYLLRAGNGEFSSAIKLVKQ